MPKIIQMPSSIQPAGKREPELHLRMVDAFEESDSLAQIQRWLDMADTVLKTPLPPHKKTA